MTLSPRWWTAWAVVLGLPMLAFGLLLAFPNVDTSFGSQSFHFYVVSGTSIGAAISCLVIVGLTKSLSETRMVFLGLAFMSIAAIFAVHGLGTPGHIHSQPYAELAVSSWLSVFVGAVFIAVSVVSMPVAAEKWFKQVGKMLFAAVATALGVYIGLSMVTPDWLAWIPAEERWLQLAMTAATLSLLAFSVWRYFHAFLFARLISQWAMVGALVLLMQVQVSLTWGQFWHLSWWLYHGTYGAAFLVLFGGWLLEARRAGSVRVLSEALSMRDALAQLGHGYSRQIADLVDAIETKDPYTSGHVRRVATYSVMMGKEFGFPTLELRSLALGAQMHDLGKISVPDSILTKPGRLTPEEFALVQRHSVQGEEIASRVSALSAATNAIRYHHERMDGSGYPEGLKGEEIPLHARIVAVADTFDAMTSGRVYQGKVSDHEAKAELRRSAGSQLDPVCVDAFLAALAKASLEDRDPLSNRTDSSSELEAA